MTEELSNYKYRGVRALVLLHEKHLRQFLGVWKEAKAADVNLPETEDENYVSLEALLQHVLGAAAWYLETMCKSLGLPNPDIDPVPEINKVEARADAHITHLLEQWRLPLAAVKEERVYPPIRTVPDGGKLNLDAMLEHAVLHPIRHEFQLRELLERQH